MYPTQAKLEWATLKASFSVASQAHLLLILFGTTKVDMLCTFWTTDALVTTSGDGIRTYDLFSGWCTFERKSSS
jgi:hypothetical protein